MHSVSSTQWARWLVGPQAKHLKKTSQTVRVHRVEVGYQRFLTLTSLIILFIDKFYHFITTSVREFVPVPRTVYFVK